jgi:hypothetical protein
VSSTLSPRALVALALAPVALGLAGCVVTPPAPPPAPARHPDYLHALTDLRDARWTLQHRPGDSAVSTQEDLAIVEIDAAIGEAKKAAAEDGKNLYQHPPEDARADVRGRLHRADELLRKARADVARDETNPRTRELRDHAVAHIDAAIRATDHAIRDAEQGR